MQSLMVLLFIATIVVGAERFDIEGKVALVTGGAQGIGYATIDALLRAGIRGVTLVDVNRASGKSSAKSLNARYGRGRVIFIPSDISNGDQFESAFNLSLQTWKGLDIVVNNAGVADEINWKVVIDINVVGTLQGTLLGFKYLSKISGGRGGVVINASSFVGLSAEFFSAPIYTASKTFVLSLGRSLGYPDYYQYNEVRVVTVCPGPTQTSMPGDNVNRYVSILLAPQLLKFVRDVLAHTKFQSPHSVGDGIRKVIVDGSHGSVWVIEDDEPPYEIDFPDRKTMRKKNI